MMTPELEDGFELYELGIQWAKGAGLIEEGAAVEDQYAHYPWGFNSTNTRLLHPLVAALLKYAQSAAHILELGAGAGVATWMAHQQRPDLVCHTLGGTPINPYLGFHNAVPHPDWGIGSHLYRMETNPYDPFTSLGRGEWTCFKALSEPFIHRQFVGNMDEFELLGPYELIWERFGPLYHALGPMRFFWRIEQAIQALKPNGAMAFTGGHQLSGDTPLSFSRGSGWRVASMSQTLDMHLVLGPEHPRYAAFRDLTRDRWDATTPIPLSLNEAKTLFEVLP